MDVASLTFVEDTIPQQTSCSSGAYSLPTIRLQGWAPQLCIWIPCGFLFVAKLNFLMRGEDCTYLWVQGQMLRMHLGIMLVKFSSKIHDFASVESLATFSVLGMTSLVLSHSEV